MTRPFLLGSVCLMAVALHSPRAMASDDPWFGPDKWLHFSGSAVLAGAGYATGSLLWEQRWQRASFGGGVALSAGIGKEVYDLTGRGDPSAKDLTWDLLGTTLGLAIALSVDLLLDDDAPAQPGANPSGFVLRF